MTRHTFIGVFGKRFASGVSVVLLSSISPVHGAEIPDDVGKNLLQAYIAPAFGHFRLAAESMRGNLQDWCAKPDVAGMHGVQAGFEHLATSWSRIEFLRFGPLVEAGRYERISFWPDPRGMTLRQVSGLLGGQGEIPDGAALASQSVALQGLPALEYVLYDDDGLLASQPNMVQAKDSKGIEGAKAKKAFSENSVTDAESSEAIGESKASAKSKGSKEPKEPKEPKHARACAYAYSIATNLVNVSTELAQAWSPGGGYARQFAEPSASNPLYRNKEEVVGEAFKALSSGMQFARDVKVMPVLGTSMSASRPKRAPFWRSGLTARTMAASVDGMLRFYQAVGLRLTSGETWMDASLRGELLQTHDTLAAMPGSVADQLNSEDGYRAWTLTTLLLRNAKGITDEHIAPALGVRIGFNALDGD